MRNFPAAQWKYSRDTWLLNFATCKLGEELALSFGT